MPKREKQRSAKEQEKKEGIVQAVIRVAAIAAALAATFPFLQTNRLFVGPVVIVLGLVALGMIKFAGRRLHTVTADIVYGAIDGGILAIITSLSALYGGVIGAIFGGILGDAVTDSIAGIFEGHIALWLRKHGVKESRTPLSSSLGKMSGVLIAAGIIISFIWAALP